MAMNTPDILTRIPAIFSQELVEYVFSFTNRELASAAGFFGLAIKLKPRHRHLYSNSLIADAALSGDLPLFRYLISQPEHRACTWQFVKSIDNRIVHVYKYIYTLFDVGSPILEGTNACLYHYSLFFSLQKCASVISDDIPVLEWLQRSNYVKQNPQPFAHWNTMVIARNFSLLRYMCSHTTFAPSRDSTDLLLRLCLEHNWVEGLTYLHVEYGARFSTWDTHINQLLTNPNAAVRVMSELNIMPEDECKLCREKWFGKIGWWGLVMIYYDVIKNESLHNADTVHALENENEFIRERCDQNTGKPYLSMALTEAVKLQDKEIIRYIRQNIPTILLDRKIVIEAIRNSDIELLRLAAEYFPCIFDGLDVSEVTNELKLYMRDGSAPKLVNELAQFLCAFPRFRKELIEMKRLILHAALEPDVEFLVWALGPEGGFRFNESDLESWRKAAQGDEILKKAVKVVDEVREGAKDKYAKGREEGEVIVGLF